MEEVKRRPSLGRGLSALFGEAAEDDTPAPRDRQTRQIPIEFLRPGRFQPRRTFDAEAIESLVASIRERGILQPLLVRRDPAAANRYEIIAGERRWRAAQQAGLHEVPAIVRELSDREALEIALIENVQRQDLTPLEEAEGYRRLMEEFQHTQEGLAKVIGKSRSHIANMIRLLGLPEPVRRHLEQGRLTAGHARALLTAPDPAALAEEVVRRGLNVRQTEALVRERSRPLPAPSSGHVGPDVSRALARAVQRAAGADNDPDTAALERTLSERLGLRVTITPRGAGGTLAIDYRTLDQLDLLLERLGADAPAAST